MQQSLMTGFLVKGGKRMSAHSPQGWLLGVVLLATAGLLRAAPDGSGPAPVVSTAAPATGSALPDASRSNLRGWNLRQTPVVEVVRRVRDAVVNIHSERTVRNSGFDEMFSNSGSQSRVNGMGTGILIDPRGYIVTNQHVVEDVALIRIRLADGTTANARVLARDHECDLALLKIDVDRLLPTIPLGTTRDLMVGETVVAIGNAYGYEHTVTVGVVSATSRDVSLNKEVSYKALIQTDASINPGNSGGPLLNVHGELIGVNVAIRAGAQGIGFAIPVDTMIRVAGRMLASRAPQGGARSRLGMGVKDEVRAAPLGSGPGETAPLRTVVVDYLEQGSPAARAGLEYGDVLRAVGDTPVVSSLDLERALLDRPAGDRIVLLHRRGTSEKRAEAVLESGRGVAIEQASNDAIWQRLGLRLRPVGAEAVNRINSQFRGGLSVTDVRPDGPAEHAGILRGDILIGLHKFEMLSTDHVHYVLSQPEILNSSPLPFYSIRGAQQRSGKILPSD